MKKRYIHYKKAGDEFLVRTVSGIYSLTSFFFFLQLILSSKTIQKKINPKVERTITENLVRKEEVLQFFLY